MSRAPSVPSYRLHKPTGQAVVTIRSADGTRRDVYLGKFNSPESRAEYGRIIAEQATGVPAPATHPAAPTVDQVMLAFWEWAQQHYRRTDGTPTNEIVEYKYALKPLHRLYGHTPAAEFGPLALKAVRGAMVEAQWCRALVNARVGRLKRAFKWAASEQLVPVATFTALTTVTGLKRGRCAARESEPVGPVEAAHVDAILPHVNRHVRGLIEFQRLTGCRPGEACAVRRCDLDAGGPVWLYTPTQHKTAWRGNPRRPRTDMTNSNAPADLRRLIAALERFGLDLGAVPSDTDPSAFANVVDVAAKNWRAGRADAARHLWQHFRIRAPIRMSVRGTAARDRIRL